MESTRSCLEAQNVHEKQIEVGLARWNDAPRTRRTTDWIEFNQIQSMCMTYDKLISNESINVQKSVLTRHVCLSFVCLCRYDNTIQHWFHVSTSLDYSACIGRFFQMIDIIGDIYLFNRSLAYLTCTQWNYLIVVRTGYVEHEAMRRNTISCSIIQPIISLGCMWVWASDNPYDWLSSSTFVSSMVSFDCFLSIVGICFIVWNRLSMLFSTECFSWIDLFFHVTCRLTSDCLSRRCFSI
jgi:hypothetical protein